MLRNGKHGNGRINPHSTFGPMAPTIRNPIYSADKTRVRAQDVNIARVMQEVLAASLPMLLSCIPINMLLMLLSVRHGHINVVLMQSS